MPEQPLRVERVEPAPGSVDLTRCTLVLHLSRNVDKYEEPELARQLGVTMHETDKTIAYWPNLNLQYVVENPGMLNGQLATAAGFGREPRERDERRAADIARLVDEINRALYQQR